MKKRQTNQDFGGFDESWDSSPETGSDFGASSGGDDFSGSSFDETPVSPLPKPRNRMGKGGQIALILGIVGALAVAGLFILLINKGNTVKNAVPGSTAPAGETAYMSPGCEMLLNELLVTGKQDMTLGSLEEKLLQLDGAVVGYLPLMNQYQIRFNTESREELEQKKEALVSSGLAERVDYNYVLKLRNDGRAAGAVSLPEVSEKSIGLMGSLPAQEREETVCFWLSGYENTDAAQMPAWIESRRGAVEEDIRADQAAALLGEKQFFASVFYFSETTEGAVKGVTTSFALRYQLFSLISAGAETIVFPYAAPATLDGSVPEEEISLNEGFLKALEAGHPSFLLCRAAAEKDCVTAALAGSETGRRHLVCVAAAENETLPVLDAAGTGKTVYVLAGKASGADLAAVGNSAETAAFHAAAVLASLRSETADCEFLKAGLAEKCGALAGDRDGAVLPTMDGKSSGGTEAPLQMLHLEALDSRTGWTVPHVTYTLITSAGTFRDTAAEGKMDALCPAGDPEIRAEAENYSMVSVESSGEPGRMTVRMAANQSVGTIAGRITLRGGGNTGELYAVLRNIGTGTETARILIEENFSLEAAPGTYDLVLSGRNRTEAIVHGLTVNAGETTRVEKEITLTVVSDMAGNAAGVVKNAMTGGTLEGVTLQFFPGMNAENSGTPVTSAVTDSNGRYSVSLPGGVYTAHISKSGFRNDSMTVLSEGETTIDNQDITITPKIMEGEIRFVLDWGPNPSDLDAHLVNNSQHVHTFFSEKEAFVDGQKAAMLDVDALGAMGPDGSNRTETTTIKKELSGTYVFYIHDYSSRDSTSSSAMAESGAKVTVYFGGEDGAKYEFHVPHEPGTLWEVFTLEGDVLTPRNIMSYESNPSHVGR